ncbi:hypothetical protein EON66_04100 [archaeon]|nr:MAG: hypothetical protein EON66_04100 [archaeon]
MQVCDAASLQAACCRGMGGASMGEGAHSARMCGWGYCTRRRVTSAQCERLGAPRTDEVDCAASLAPSQPASSARSMQEGCSMWSYLSFNVGVVWCALQFIALCDHLV